MIDNEKWIYNIKYTALLLTGRSSDAIYWFFELTGKIDMTEMQLYDAKIDSAEKLIDWYRKSANDNNVLLARILFDMYSESGRRDDMLEACKWCVKAANLGNAECQRALDGDLNDGSFYFYRDSYHYVKLVAEHKARRGKELGFGGFVANQESYNDCYDWSIGIPKYLADSLKYYRLKDDAFCEYESYLWLICENRKGVDKNSKEAVKWYKLVSF